MNEKNDDNEMDAVHECAKENAERTREKIKRRIGTMSNGK